MLTKDLAPFSIGLHTLQKPLNDKWNDTFLVAGVFSWVLLNQQTGSAIIRPSRKPCCGILPVKEFLKIGS